MSYEGYIRVLCKSGHLHSFDCYDLPDFLGEYGEAWKCPDCGEKAVFENSVNLTNGSICQAWDEENNECREFRNERFTSYCDEKQHKECVEKKGRIDGYIELEEFTPAKIQTCNLGHIHIIEPATYKVPEKGGRKI